MTAGTTSLTHRRPLSERVIERLLFLAAAVGVLTTVGIITVLALETFEFFLQVSPIEFFTGSRWSALIKPQAWGVLALISGTLLVAGIGLLIAVPLGLLAAVLLSEFASTRVRTIVKPALETIAGVPTIVLGFFGLNFIAPQLLRPLLGADNIGVFSALSGGIVVGLLITPLIAYDLRGRHARGPARPARGRLCNGRDEVRGRPQGCLSGRPVRDHGLD